MKLDTLGTKATYVKPPKGKYSARTSVFLAGSIEMGKAEDWQTKVEKALAPFEINVFNPRRDDWDNTWKQTLDDKNFHGQVKWEFDHLSKANIIFLYLDPATKSPISLMELGLFAGHKDKTVIVVCPDGFYRKGNVEFICKQFKLELHNDLKSGINSLISKLKARATE